MEGFANEVQAYKIWFGHEDGPREGGIWILSKSLQMLQIWINQQNKNWVPLISN